MEQDGGVGRMASCSTAHATSPGTFLGISRGVFLSSSPHNCTSLPWEVFSQEGYRSSYC